MAKKRVPISEKKAEDIVNKVIDSPNQLVCYANLASVSFTLEEAILHFGERTAPGMKNGVGIAKIYISLPHAKRLAGALSRTVEAYEKDFGQIQADPGQNLSPEALEKFGISRKDINSD